MSNQYLEITCGIPASGKSTYAKREALKGNIFVSERDHIRARLSDYDDINKYKFSKAKEGVVTSLQKGEIFKAIKSGANVIVADTNCKPSSVEYFKDMATELGVEFRVKHFDTPLRDCIKRNLKRHATVPESVLIRMEKSRRQMTGQYVWDESNPDNLPEVVICDIDATLADMKGVRGPFEWDKVGLDKPRQFVCDMISSIQDRRDYEVIFFSGRDEVCRKETEQWLLEHTLFHSGCQLYMREEGSFANDCEVKEQMFINHIKNKYHVSHIVDDRKQVVMMWKSLGFPVLDAGSYLNDF